MTYLDDNPELHDSLLLERDDALWLVSHDAGCWTLPTFVAEEQHTAEVERFGQHVQARYGLKVCLLGAVLSEFDPAANRMRRAYLAELAAGTLAEGRWWPRRAIIESALELHANVAALVERWAGGALKAGDALWNRTGWLEEARAWVSAQVGPVYDIEQVRVSESSTVMRVLASGRTLYFKAVAPEAAREPPVTAALARLTTHVPPVRAVDTGRRLLLMEAVSGKPLDARDMAVWCTVARALSELQRRCVDAVSELRSLGCEVASARKIVEPFSELLADEDGLLVGKPAGLTSSEVARLHSVAPELVAEAGALDDGLLPLTVDHGDLWPSNVLVGPEACAFVDWEDVRIAHPFMTPFQLLAGAHMDHRFADEDAAYAAIREAYLEGWGAWAPAPVLRRAFDMAHDIAAVGVASSYRCAPPELTGAHPWIREMPAFCLRRILARRGYAPSFPWAARAVHGG
jgi:hypothetical protein